MAEVEGYHDFVIRRAEGRMRAALRAIRLRESAGDASIEVAPKHGAELFWALMDMLAGYCRPENFADGRPIELMPTEAAERLRHLSLQIWNNESPAWFEAGRPKVRPMPIITQQSYGDLVRYVRAARGEGPRTDVLDLNRVRLAELIADAIPIETARSAFEMTTANQVHEVLRDGRFGACDPFDLNPDYSIADRAEYLRGALRHAGQVWRENKTRKSMERAGRTRSNRLSGS